MVISCMFWPDSSRLAGSENKGGGDKGRGVACNVEEGCKVIKAFTLMEVELVCKVCASLFFVLSDFCAS